MGHFLSAWIPDPDSEYGSGSTDLEFGSGSETLTEVQPWQLLETEEEEEDPFLERWIFFIITIFE